MHDQDDQDDCTPESLVCFWYHLMLSYASNMLHCFTCLTCKKLHPRSPRRQVAGCCGSCGILLVSFTIARHKAVRRVYPHLYWFQFAQYQPCRSWLLTFYVFLRSSAFAFEFNISSALYRQLEHLHSVMWCHFVSFSHADAGWIPVTDRSCRSWRKGQGLKKSIQYLTGTTWLRLSH